MTLEQALEAIERVRELHSPHQSANGQLICNECTGLSRDFEDYPCLTIQALDGEL